jgi:hypothetical protein
MSYGFINAPGISELLSKILAVASSVEYLFFSRLAYFIIERAWPQSMYTQRGEQL